MGTKKRERETPPKNRGHMAPTVGHSMNTAVCVSAFAANYDRYREKLTIIAGRGGGMEEGYLCLIVGHFDRRGASS